MHPRVAIAIVNWNNYIETKNCLTSLKQIAYPDYVIWLVDNGSTDGSSQCLSEEFPEVVLLRNGRNSGFAAGNNLALLRGLQDEAIRYFLLLNNDTVVTNPQFLSELVVFLENHPDTGVVGPLIRLMDNSIQTTIGYFPTIRNSIYYGFMHRPVASQQLPTEADCLVGACLLVRLETVRQAGLMDEAFFMYGEEHEWQYRIKQAGWRIQYLPIESINHHHGLSARKISKQAYLLKRSNTVYILVKHGYRGQAAVTAALYLIYHAARTVKVRFDSSYQIPSMMELLQSIVDRWHLAVNSQVHAGAQLRAADGHLPGRD